MNLVEADGVPLVRRFSGGGAGYVDLGMFGFSLYYGREHYERLTADENNPFPTITVLMKALRSLGIPSQRSGRNDVLVDGRKISGSSGYHDRLRSSVGASILLDVNFTKFGRYLSPSRAKLEAKGIKSVEARVINLKQAYPEVTMDILFDATLRSFLSNNPGKSFEMQTMDWEELETIAEFQDYVRLFKDPEFIFGSTLAFTNELNTRFPWGQFEVLIESAGKLVISKVKIYSDCLDTSIVPALEAALAGAKYSSEGVRSAVASAKAALASANVVDIENRNRELDEFAQWMANSL